MEEFGTPRGVETHELDGTTGRSLVLLEEDTDTGLKTLRAATGSAVATATEKRLEPKADGALHFEELGVAVVSQPADQVLEASAAAEGGAGIIAVEPERRVHVLEGVPVVGARSDEYLWGYRDAVVNLTDGLAPRAPGAVAAAPMAAALVESQATWGLQAVKAVHSCRSGAGINVAVLDTGFDPNHPDFAGRNVTMQSFIPGETADDGHGHGTHCIGTALGPKCPPLMPRYGVAYEAEIFVGKVLSNGGSGGDAGILAGINWAVANGCAVISMSLGARVRLGQAPSRVFENVARRAARRGSLIVAAAGNDSQRPGRVEPVSHPANCPSILAVAAVDVNGAVASFSNGGLNPNGGKVDVSGPGVNVYSSWPMPTRYRRLNGTSMATPHAAGVAALLAEANPAVRGAALGALLVSRALPGTLPAVDVGAGMVQAP
ncbi:MAG TPA: S8 family serine peptidase [Thermoleophilaceae bacterium]|nr:S8 family serine peptidase [Thermoleophilaceae bacterium]